MYESLLDTFEAFTLEELESHQQLMSRRFEIKFAFHISLLEIILEACRPDCRILAVNGLRQFNYENRYFDTGEMDFFHAHHIGRSTRFKVRKRTYTDSGSTFIEIKKKSPSGITYKFREESDSMSLSASFIQQNSAVRAETLNESIQNNYKRITLLSKDGSEKITLDFDLRFSHHEKKSYFQRIAIAEVKSVSARAGYFCKLMRSMGIREGGMSKYCMGIISLNEDIRHNHFKPEYKSILKLNTNDGE